VCLCVVGQSNFHAQRLLQSICRYQCDSYLCDTVIVTDDGRLSAHSNVLAAASPVFRAALKVTDRPMQHIVVIPWVTSAVMRSVLQFVYTGEIPMLPNDLSTVLSVLLELKLLRLQQPCDEYVTDFKPVQSRPEKNERFLSIDNLKIELDLRVAVKFSVVLGLGWRLMQIKQRIFKHVDVQVLHFS